MHFKDHQDLFGAILDVKGKERSPEQKAQEVENNLFSSQSYKRKRQIGRLVHSCITSI